MDFQKIYDEAVSAAKTAETKFRTEFGEPMYCGFAWVEIHPGNCPFANWLKKNNHGRKGYPSGVHIWNPGGSYTQSMEIKECGSRAFVDVLFKHGIKARMGSRPD